MFSVRCSAIIAVVLITGCATPAPVKEALTSLDRGYADNRKMMQQYRDLVVQINDRYGEWDKYVNTRLKLSVTLAWATTDPVGSLPDEASRIKNTDAYAEMLGPQLVSLVNCIRLRGLPGRSGASGVVFAASGSAVCADKQIAQQASGTMTTVIQALPRIVREIDVAVEKEEALKNASNDLGGFDAYKTNIEVLATVNSVIKRYLDIDVTVKPGDVKEIAESIRQLNR